MSSVLFCFVERRDAIDPEWEIIAGLICADMCEAEELVKSYQDKHFDICEYQARSCTEEEFNTVGCRVTMVSPGARGKLAC